jgi:hypothetical protein
MSPFGRFCCRSPLKRIEVGDSVAVVRFATGAELDGRLNHEQEQFFYSFRLDDAVRGDHPVRRIAAVLDLGWVYSWRPITLGLAVLRSSRCRRHWVHANRERFCQKPVE